MHNAFRLPLIMTLALSLSGCPSALHMAAYKGNTEKMNHLLDAGADINAHTIKFLDSLTPLHTAINTNKIEAVQLLVERGADLNALDVDGNPPLCKAILFERREEIVKILLTAGSNPDMFCHWDNRFMPALAWAKEMEKPQIVKWLQEAIAEKTSLDRGPKTNSRFHQ